MKKTFLFLAALVMSAMMMADEVTMSYSGSETGNMTGGNDAALVNLDATTWSVIGDKGGNNNFPGLNKAGQIRLYGSATNHNTITVTNLAEANITSIKVTYGTSNYNAKVTVDGAEVTGTGSDAEKTYAINSTSFTIAHNYSANTQVYILSIVITTGGTPTPQKEVVDVKVTDEPTKMEYFVGESFDPAGLTVTAMYDDASTEDVTSKATWTIEPATFTEASESASVSVKAEFNKVKSKPRTITGIVVKAKEVTYANTYTSNVELSAEGGTSASAAKVVIGGTEYDAIKAGTSSAAGACVVTIPAATKTLHFHAAGWNKENVVLNETINLVADAGVSNSSPFTLQNDPETQDYFTLDPQGATTITFTATSGKRFVVFGVNAELKEGVVAAPTFTPAETNFDQEVTVTLASETEGVNIFYTLDGSSPIDNPEDRYYSKPFKLTKTTTIKAFAIDQEGKRSAVSEKTYTLVPAYTVEELAAITPTGQTFVLVLNEDEIVDTYTKDDKDGLSGIYFQATAKKIELYQQNYAFPKTWEVGGTISGRVMGEWTDFNGTWELKIAQDEVAKLSYTAPEPTALPKVMMQGNIRKAMYKGRIMILKGDKMFNLHGMLVK